MEMDIQRETKIPQWAVLIGFAMLGWISSHYIDGFSQRDKQTTDKVQTQEIDLVKFSLLQQQNTKQLTNISVQLEEIKSNRFTNRDAKLLIEPMSLAIERLSTYVDEVDKRSKLRDNDLEENIKEINTQLKEIKELLEK